LHNLQRSAGQTQLIYSQRKELFVLQWWSILAQIFCFDCVA